MWKHRYILARTKSSEEIQLYILLYLKKYFWLDFRSVMFSVNFYLKKSDDAFLKEFSKTFSKFVVYITYTTEVRRDYFLSLVVTGLIEFMERKISLFGQIYLLIIHQI